MMYELKLLLLIQSAEMLNLNEWKVKNGIVYHPEKLRWKQEDLKYEYHIFSI